MRLGFVGVGRWAQKLKAAFVAEGAEVIGHVRGNRCGCGGEANCPYCHPAGFGAQHNTWQALMARPDIDALVLCAPPEATTEVALACAASAKPVMATKPLMLDSWPGAANHPKIGAPFYVDFWRLWDEGYLRMFDDYRKESPAIKEIYVGMYGSGPERSFPGLLDYGPHAVAFVRHLTQDVFDSLTHVRGESLRPPREFFWFVMNAENQAGNGIPCTVQTGNDAGDSHRLLRFRNLAGEDFLWSETPIETYYEARGVKHVFKKEDSFRRMCRSFMNDIAQSFVSTEHLDLSCAVMRDLAEVRRLAEEKP